MEGTVFDHNDPSLKTGLGGLTVWDLKRMVEEKRFSELENLFNNGLNMNSLPVGYAAGAAFGLLGGESKLITEWLDILVDRNWRGKVFFSSNDKRVSQGRNRINFAPPRTKVVEPDQFEENVPASPFRRRS